MEAEMRSPAQSQRSNGSRANSALSHHSVAGGGGGAPAHDAPSRGSRPPSGAMETEGAENHAPALQAGDALDAEMQAMTVRQGNGFRNLIPRDRTTRLVEGNGNKRHDSKDRDLMEKGRLAQRTGSHYRYQPPRQAVLPEPGYGSVSYADELDRFTRDSAAAEFAQRQRTMHRKNHVIDLKAHAHLERETERWRSVEEKYEYDRARELDLKNEPLAQRNKNSVCYNPITMRKDSSHNAQLLQYDEDMVRRRAAQRANNLYSRGHSQPYNVLTGAPVQMQKLAVPERPTKPGTPQSAVIHAKAHRTDLAYGEAIPNSHPNTRPAKQF
jgi:hypothetical protein